jgi:aryl-alcohol dehydrogenase-like predicted oxidoreductase
MKDAKHSLMTYIEVCHRADCKKFSRLVMGTDHLGELGENDSLDTQKALALEMLDLAVEYGINAFDTAPIYVGGIERTLGGWMKDKRAADSHIDLYTITKGGFPFDEGPGNYKSRLKETKENIITNISGELAHSLPNLMVK